MPIPTQAEPLQLLTAKERIYAVLRDWIIDGTLQPEENLYDTKLAKFFSVSRTPVREAFQMLESQKLIKMIPGKGVIVTQINPKNIRDWCLPLMSLYSLAAEIVTPIITEAQIVEMEKMNATLISAIENSFSDEIYRLDKEFHRKIILLAKNPYILDFTDNLNLQSERINTIFCQKAKYHLHFAKEHYVLLNHFRARDAEAAAANVRKNQLHVMQLMEDYFAGRNQEQEQD